MRSVMGMARLPTREEIENVFKKIKMGFELTDWEIWVCREFVDG